MTTGRGSVDTAQVAPADDGTKPGDLTGGGTDHAATRDPTGQPTPGQQGGARRPARALTGRRNLPYLLAAPALLFELLVHIIPMLVGVLVSFFQLNEFHFRTWLEAPFVALRNFRVAVDLDSPIGAGLLQSTAITVAFTVVVIGLSWLLGIAGALAINDQVRGRGPLQALLLIPYALPIYVAIINWRFVLSKDGALNALLADTNLMNDPPFWLFGEHAFWSMVMTGVWRSWPFAFLILLAGLQSISPELYHAASVDGASAWRRFRHVTLPLLRPVNSVLLLVLFLWTFNDFNLPYVLFGTSPPEAADVLAVHIYVNSFVNFDFGLGAAMSVLLLMLLLVLCAIYLRAFRVGRSHHA